VIVLVRRISRATSCRLVPQLQAVARTRHARIAQRDARAGELGPSNLPRERGAGHSRGSTATARPPHAGGAPRTLRATSEGAPPARFARGPRRGDAPTGGERAAAGPLRTGAATTASVAPQRDSIPQARTSRPTSARSAPTGRAAMSTRSLRVRSGSRAQACAASRTNCVPGGIRRADALDPKRRRSG
jgi:hypothetical protein